MAPPSTARPQRCGDGEDDGGGLREGEAADGGDAEVVADDHRQRRQPHQVGEHQVAEVVVVDRVAAHPRIGRRHAVGAQQAVEEGEVHVLLGAEDVGRHPALEDEEQKADRPQPVVAHELAPAAAAQPVAERRALHERQRQR